VNTLVNVNWNGL